MSPVLVLIGDGAEATATTLDEFLADNAEVMTADEMSEVRAEVEAGRCYLGGGGAAEPWALGGPAAMSAHLAERGA